MTTAVFTRPASRAWAVWLVGTVAYYAAVFSRTSLSAAGDDAIARYHITAFGLSMFSVLQLLVYATLQIPVGTLIDRFGPRALIASGAALMAIGQVTLAFSDTLPVAITARILIGAGDAMTFVSVLRLVAAWFPPRLVPIMSQVTGMLGGLGQLASVIPLAALLGARGWTTTFQALGALLVLSLCLALGFLRNGAAHPHPEAHIAGLGESFRLVRDSWRNPGTRLGFWVHFSCPFGGTVFGILWGYPFLESGEGLSIPQTQGVFAAYTLLSIVAGPIVGTLTARYQAHRASLALGIVASQVAAWALVLLWPGAAPLGVLYLLAGVLAIGGPGSLIAFDLARTNSTPERLGGALGTVNVGGFVAALVAIALIGVLLDAQGAGTPATYTLAAFRSAMSIQILLWFLGAAGILISRRHVKAAEPALEGVLR
ncbi:MFS transporter [Frondihabitans cladoniiphilus]|uniref:MFS transporter n=1 Tax=Frondihabitans cladoniiphilus TaxID=715785 RepID=A0ABP8WBF2_9MICO